MSPDGRRAFLRFLAPDTRPVGPTPGLGYIYDLRTGGMMRVGDLDGWIFVRWLPDGGLLAYGQAWKPSGTGYDGEALYVEPAGKQTVLHRGAQVIDAFVDPRGRRAAIFTGDLQGADLLVVDLPPGDKHLYPHIATPGQTPNGVPEMEAEWSPDGGTIAYRDAGTGGDDRGVIWLLDPSSGEKQRLAEGRVHLNYWTSSWSPDGQHLFLQGIGIEDGKGQPVFRHEAPGGGFWSPGGDRIYIYGKGLVDTRTWQLVRKAELNHTQANWSPDGRYLLVEGLGLLDAAGKTSISLISNS